MMELFSKPRIVFSRCLGFASCRYNGGCVNDAFVARLAEFCEPFTPCPEVEIGLGIPRDSVRIIEDENNRSFLIQPATGQDFSVSMLKYANHYLTNLSDIDGFLLKSKSPSCGRGTVKVYRQPSDCIAVSQKSDGFFARAVKDHFPLTPFEDEGRLNNYIIRERFLTQIFTLARFREIAARESFSELQFFHAANKELLRFYNQQLKQKMGRLLGDFDGGSPDALIDAYGQLLREAMASHPRPAALANFFEHALGFFKNDLNAVDKDLFISHMSDWKLGRLPVSALLTLIRSWAQHFKKGWLLEQTILRPYPPELNDIHDSGKGRDL